MLQALVHQVQNALMTAALKRVLQTGQLIKLLKKTLWLLTVNHRSKISHPFNLPTILPEVLLVVVSHL